MDMSGDQTVANLPISDPKCNSEDCIAFAAAANLSQEITPWAGQFEYGHWVTWYYVIIVFCFMVVYGFCSWLDHRAAANTPRTKSSRPKQKLVALVRYLSYRRIKGRAMDSLELPSAGVLGILLLTVAFVGALAFAARPYYREHEGFGSPPIAIRSGLMAYACAPITIALAGKANVITLLTGVSHEKLNVIHRWVGWMTLVLSLIHTVPFFYAPLHDVGYTTLHSEFYGSGLGGATMVGLYDHPDQMGQSSHPSSIVVCLH
jgi:Ferric reductase like transmembrane component